MKRTKSINELTRQRNHIQEWLIVSDAWKRHTTLYKKTEDAWQRYIANIEFFAKKKLNWEGFNSVFANKRYPKSIYDMKRKKTVDDISKKYQRILKMRYPKVRINKNGSWNFHKVYPNVDLESDAWFIRVRNIYNNMIGV